MCQSFINLTTWLLPRYLDFSEVSDLWNRCLSTSTIEHKSSLSLTPWLLDWCRRPFILHRYLSCQDQFIGIFPIGLQTFCIHKPCEKSRSKKLWSNNLSIQSLIIRQQAAKSVECGAQRKERTEEATKKILKPQFHISRLFSDCKLWSRAGITRRLQDCGRNKTLHGGSYLPFAYYH